MSDIRPLKGKLLAERIYEETTTENGIIVDNGHSHTNPFIVKMKVIEDRTVNAFAKDTLVLCQFVGILDMTGEEKIYLVHESAMEALLGE
jgi:co-chaperonin GroES (HSP10)